jgi:ATP-dependent Lon protease
VLEYLLAQYCSSDDENVIQQGIISVKEILRKHYVHRNLANMVRSEISRLGRLKVIDKVGVDFVSSTGVHEVNFSNLGINHVLIDDDTVRKHRKLLIGDVWAISDIEYVTSDERAITPWLLNSLKPIQLSDLDIDDATFQSLLKKDVEDDGKYKMKK